MDEIKYLEKPEWISWEAVADCLHAAHSANTKNGFVMPGIEMPGDELCSRIGDGHCFVAIDND